IQPHDTASQLAAEVVGFRDDRLILMPFSDTHGVAPGCTVTPSGRAFSVPVGNGLLGRVIDGLAEPIDGRGPLEVTEHYPVSNRPPGPLARQPIREQLCTGVRSLD